MKTLSIISIILCGIFFAVSFMHGLNNSDIQVSVSVSSIFAIIFSGTLIAHKITELKK